MRQQEANEPQTLGQTPVGMRQYIANIVLIPDKSKAAYTRGIYTVYSDTFFVLGVIAHETTHIFDLIAFQDVVKAGGYPEGTYYSDTAEWLDAYRSSAAVPSRYADTNQKENLAETGRWSLSAAVHPGGLAAYNKNWGTIGNQIVNFRGRTDKIIYPKDGHCTAKVNSTPAVHVTNGKAKFRARRAPQYSSMNGATVPEIKVPEGLTADRTLCSSELGGQII